MSTRKHPSYGNKRDYPKIEIFVNGEYFGTTTWARTLRQAKDELVKKYDLDPSRVTAAFKESR